MGDATRQDLSLRGLQNARGFLQSKIAERIETRYTPRLRFIVDMGVKRSIEVAEILDRVLAEGKPSATQPAEVEELVDDEADQGQDGSEPLDHDSPNDDEPAR
jgi:ribosome-binding factor A